MVYRPSSPENRRGSLLAAALIALAALAIYANSFSVPFLFDDAPSAVDNPTIRHLWPLWEPLSPPHQHLGLTVEGRPLLNLSLAVNYAISGTSVWSYHALNLLIHILAGLTLFGIVRRTLQNAARAGRPVGRSLGEAGLESASRTDHASLLLAFAVALLWTVHPLQTESVTYIIQRAESLMGLFYLLTLYCFIRFAERGSAFARAEPVRRTSLRAGEAGADEEAGGAFWAWLSIGCCLLGMATKEVMASAPLLVLIYDATFVTGGYREAWRRRRTFYLFLAGTWLMVVSLALWTGNRGGTAGFGINIKPWTYALTQFQAIAHYLWLVFWPHPLIFDYGTRWVERASQVVPYALVVGALVAVTVAGLRRRSPAGFLGVWIFAILAPTSSIIPGNRQTLAEHRMYLPLAAVIAATVCGGGSLLARRPALVRRAAPWLVALFAVAVGLGGLSFRRNEDYRSQLVLYRDSVMKRPDNGFAHYNLGKVLDESGSPLEAIEQYRESIQCDPTRSAPYDNLGKTLSDLGRLPEAVKQCQAALRINPNDSIAHDNLGRTFLKMGRKEEARDQFYDVSLLHPDDVEARDNLGGVLLELGQTKEAIAQLLAALRINPHLFETHYMLGNAYLLQNRPAEAIAQYEETLRLKPDLADAKANLAVARRAAAP